MKATQKCYGTVEKLKEKRQHWQKHEKNVRLKV